MNHNLGLFYYRTFFTKFFDLNEDVREDDKQLASKLREINMPFLETAFNDEMDRYSKQISMTNYHGIEEFRLTTIYPGLLCGVGYEHELGFQNEFKLGFLFDHTTGLPYLSGSSIKGALRNYFSMKDYMLGLLSEMLINIDKENDWASDFEETTKQKLKDYLKAQALKTIDWKQLEKTMFEGADFQSEMGKASTYKRDIFLDAYISKSENENGKILDDDYLTSHQNNDNPALSPFTNPNPVRFLKVSSAVTFNFQFRLVDTQISDRICFSKEIKLELFKQILLDQGIGAKTNVGYGQFKQHNTTCPAT